MHRQEAADGLWTPDNNCYAPGLPQNAASFIDLNVAESPDPSEKRESVSAR